MKIISTDKLFCSEMFSRKGWERLREEVPIDEYLHTDDETQFEGFLKFRDIWLEDNELSINIDEHDNIFFDEWSQKKVRYDGKNLENDLIARWAEYLLRD